MVEREESSDDEQFSVGDGGKCAAACIGCCLLTVLILILCSISGLPATQYGLLKNKFSGTVDFKTVHFGGRNFIGFWNSYLEFPSTLQSLEWLSSAPTTKSTRDLSPMDVRTKDGLMVTLGVCAQYRLVREKVPDLYRQHKMSYESAFISSLRSAFQVLIADYTSEELWTQRQAVATAMKAECDNVCSTVMYGWLTCWGVQMLELDLEPGIEKRITDRQVQEQLQEYEKMKQIATQIRAQTRVIETEYDRNITVVNARANADAYQVKQQAIADAEFNTQKAQADSLQIISNTVKNGATPMNSKQLLSYVEKVALLSNPNSALAYGYNQANVFLNNHEL